MRLFTLDIRRWIKVSFCHPVCPGPECTGGARPTPGRSCTVSKRTSVIGPRSARQAAPPAGSRCSASGTVPKVGSETYKNPDSSSLQKPPVAGLATMGRLQLSKDEDRDRDPEGTRTCHRWVHWLKAIYREKYRQLQCFQKCPNFGLNPNSDLCTRQP